MSNQKTVNWNTLILAISVPLFSFFAKELYKEARSTHDTVILIKAQMVPHSEFDVQIAEVRSQIAEVRSRISALDIELEQLKRERERKAP